MPKLFWRRHEYGGKNRIRVWQEGWVGDEFNILMPTEFEALKLKCEAEGQVLEMADDEEE